MAAVGLMFPPDRQALALLEPLLDDIDYGGVTPETLWGPGRAPNAFHGILAQLAGVLPFVAHGVAANLCGAEGGHWPDHLRALARDHAIFRFLWASDHLGAVKLGSEHVGLPVPIDAPPARLRRRLGYLRALVGTAAVENSAVYAWPGPMADEARALGESLGQEHHLLLDVHNLWTGAINAGESPQAWLDAAPLDRVIEIHISGGKDAPPAWSPDRRRRLDSHDDAIPEPVWGLLEQVLPRCPGLRGVTLERVEGSFGAPEIPRLREELQRARELSAHHGLPLGQPQQGSLNAALELLDENEVGLAEPHLARAYRCREVPEGLDPQGFGIACRLVLRLRFERLIHGDVQAAQWFERDDAGFAAEMARYHREVPMTASTPWDEAALWRAWRAQSPSTTS